MQAIIQVRLAKSLTSLTLSHNALTQVLIEFNLNLLTFKIAMQSTKSSCNNKSGYKGLQEDCKILGDKMLGIFPSEIG